jgi:hypothetical protein
MWDTAQMNGGERRTIGKFPKATQVPRHRHLLRCTLKNKIMTDRIGKSPCP